MDRQLTKEELETMRNRMLDTVLQRAIETYDSQITDLVYGDTVNMIFDFTVTVDTRLVFDE